MNDSHETLVKLTGLKFPEPIDKGLYNLIKPWWLGLINYIRDGALS